LNVHQAWLRDGETENDFFVFRIVEAKRAVGHSEWEAVNKVKCEQVWRNTEEVCLNVLRKETFCTSVRNVNRTTLPKKGDRYAYRQAVHSNISRNLPH
jgi:hypothetical protein